ncbi:MAG: DUF92 domain-containing protein [Candidatus Diapherotrites archaeon]|uniref:DUF92 domain-containing protein n=1 Tax=Candidatus Iainarchaeum sp. TaxID=3101447 RepID=A0A938YTT0_9ARCH|nr:DUF92 domain-containing protein [Candidatus Diapherotrites archaeon]
MAEPLHAAIVLIVLFIFSIISYKKKQLDFEGILIANIVGILIFLLGNTTDFFVIVFFFVAAALATVYARKKKPAKHEVRTTGNILGNSGTAILALAFEFPLGFFAAMAAALADTLSSEIGLLSKKKPVLITNFREVEPGTDGGITRLGLLASVIGAAAIASIHFILFQSIWLFAVLVISGFVGSIVDSIFGALFERKKMLNNAEVNFLGSMGGVAAALALTSIGLF